MKKSLLISFLFCLLSIPSVFAQDKTLTLEDAVIGQWRDLYPENIRGLSWIPETDHLSWLEDNTLVHSSAKSDEINPIITLEELNNLLDLEDNKLKGFPQASWIKPTTLIFSHNHQWFIIDPFKKELIRSTKLNPQARNTDYCQANQHIAYTLDNNLFIQSFSGKTTDITRDEDQGIVNGQEVHRREFGIHTGTFWSPNGNKLAFYRKDERMVSDYPLVDIESRIAGHQPIKYPMAGMKSHHVTIGVYDLESGDTLFLDTGQPRDQYLTNVAWGPEEKYIYVAVLNRDQNHMKLNRYDAESGQLDRSLFDSSRIDGICQQKMITGSR